VIALVFACNSAVYQTMLTFTPVYLTNRLGMTRLEGASLFSLYLALGAIGTIAGGVLSDRFGKKVMIAVAAALNVPVLLLFPRAEPRSVVVFLAALGFLLYVLAPIVQAFVADIVSPEQRSAAYGFQNTLTFLGGMVGPFIFGVLADMEPSFTMAFYCLTAITCTRFVLSLYLREK
jgi:FSR family fosmidomycin resistance protein-like MFS transporter